MKTNYDLTQLMTCAKSGSIPDLLDLINTVTDIKAIINAKDVEGMTALMYAIKFDHIEISKCLVMNAADPNIQNKDGDTALIISIRGNHFEQLESLFMNKADPNIQNDDGDTALIIATRSSSPRKVKYLLEHKANPNIQNDDGDTALIIAANIHNVSIIECLFEHGADINIQNYKGNDALLIAAKSNLPRTIEFLLEHNADINIQNYDGNTPLLIATKNNLTKTVQCLLEHNADINTQNNDGDTALVIAQKKKYEQIIDCLLERGAGIRIRNINSNQDLSITTVDKASTGLQQHPSDNNARRRSSDASKNSLQNVSDSNNDSKYLNSEMLEKLFNPHTSISEAYTIAQALKRILSPNTTSRTPDKARLLSAADVNYLPIYHHMIRELAKILYKSIQSELPPIYLSNIANLLSAIIIANNNIDSMGVLEDVLSCIREMSHIYPHYQIDIIRVLNSITIKEPAFMVIAKPLETYDALNLLANVLTTLPFRDITPLSYMKDIQSAMNTIKNSRSYKVVALLQLPKSDISNPTPPLRISKIPTTFFTSSEDNTSHLSEHRYDIREIVNKIDNENKKIADIFIHTILIKPQLTLYFFEDTLEGVLKILKQTTLESNIKESATNALTVLLNDLWKNNKHLELKLAIIEHLLNSLVDFLKNCSDIKLQSGVAELLKTFIENTKLPNIISKNITKNDIRSIQKCLAFALVNITIIIDEKKEKKYADLRITLSDALIKMLLTTSNTYGQSVISTFDEAFCSPNLPSNTNKMNMLKLLSTLQSISLSKIAQHEIQIIKSILYPTTAYLLSLNLWTTTSNLITTVVPLAGQFLGNHITTATIIYDNTIQSSLDGTAGNTTDETPLLFDQKKEN